MITGSQNCNWNWNPINCPARVYVSFLLEWTRASPHKNTAFLPSCHMLYITAKHTHIIIWLQPNPRRSLLKESTFPRQRFLRAPLQDEIEAESSHGWMKRFFVFFSVSFKQPALLSPGQGPRLRCAGVSENNAGINKRRRTLSLTSNKLQHIGGK